MTLGRPLEFDPQTALDAAMHQFWVKGYNATSLQDLLNCMRISKSSFYQAYLSKEDLFLNCITHYCEQKTKELEDNLVTSSSGIKFIYQEFNSIIANSNKTNTHNGCLLVNTVNEFGQRNKNVSKLANNSLKKFENIFKKALLKAQNKKEISKNKNLKANAFYLVSNLCGLQTMIKNGAKKKDLQDHIKIMMHTIQ